MGIEILNKQQQNTQFSYLLLGTHQGLYHCDQIGFLQYLITGKIQIFNILQLPSADFIQGIP